MSKYINPSDCIPDKEYILNGVKVCEYLIKNHNINNIDLPLKRKKALNGITIHNTDDLANIEDDGRNYTAATVNANMRTVRVHYYVDDICAWKNLDDDSQNWSCADGSGDGNSTTIAIECIMKNSYDSASLKAMDNCARLTAYLLKKYNLTTKDVYTHTYWLHKRDKDCISKCGNKDKICTIKHSYKTCPLYIIPQWDKFLALINKYLKELGGKIEVIDSKYPVNAATPLTYKIKVIDNYLNVRKNAGLTYPVVCTIKKNEVYTIIEEKTVKNKDGSASVWGRLKSKAGWLNVGDRYVKKI